MCRRWILRGGVRTFQKVGALCTEAWRHENAENIQGCKNPCVTAALEASGDKVGDIDRGQASSVPAWTGTVVSPNTDNLKDLYKMCIPILLLQTSDGSYGLGVNAHTSKCIQGPSQAHTSKRIQCRSLSTRLLMLHVEKRKQGFPTPSPITALRSK